MIVVTTLLFVFASLHFWLQFTSKYLALFKGIDVNIESPYNRTADVVASLSDFLGQMVLTYRLWVVWGRKTYITIVPILAAVASVVCLNASYYIWAHSVEVTDFPSEGSIPVGVAGFALSTFVSLLVTSLIVGRIWWISSGVQKTLDGANILPKGSNSSVRTAIEVSIESGLLIAVIQVFLLVFYAIGHPALVLVWSMAAQIYTFAPTLIILRIGLTSPPGSSTSGTNASAISTLRFTNEVTQITLNTYDTYDTDTERNSGSRDDSEIKRSLDLTR